MHLPGMGLRAPEFQLLGVSCCIVAPENRVLTAFAYGRVVSFGAWKVYDVVRLSMHLTTAATLGCRSFKS